MLLKLAPPELRLVDIPVGKLPLYSRDYDADFPAGARAFKNAVDALIFVTLEYSRSILSFVNSPGLANPEAYIHFTEGLIDDDGNVPVPSTEADRLKHRRARLARTPARRSAPP